MKQSRISIALETGAFLLPAESRIAVFSPLAEDDFSALPITRVDIIQGFKPDHDAWASRGYATFAEARNDYGLSIIMLPRAKAEARAMIAEAARLTPNGLIVVDGQKTDGIDSMFKECRKRTTVSPAISKAHGKLFFFNSSDCFDGWIAGETIGPDGYTTAPGVFSADKIDRGSQALIATLPQKLGRRVADLGAGWGYLSANILGRDGVEEIHLIEAEYAAINCARINVTDPRAHFHWADATRFKPDVPFDTIITNPPFHTSRAANPALGRAFIAAAVRMLSPAGQLWLVANRHLPYENTLSDVFQRVEEIGGDKSFKVLKASHAKRGSRASG